jgi:hypothetical protein
MLSGWRERYGHVFVVRATFGVCHLYHLKNFSEL